MKMDITIGTNSHMNIGDFSSIEPNVQVTVKDVDSENYNEVYEQVKNIVETTTVLQGLNDFEEIVSVVQANESAKEYFRNIFKNKDEIDEIRLESIKKLDDIKNKY